IPCQREVGFAGRVAQTFDECLQQLDEATLEQFQGLLDQDLDGIKAEIARSGIQRVDGRLAVVPRWTMWSKETVTFPLNPDPKLGQGSRGERIIDFAERFLREHPFFAGLYLDSLGWLLEYRNFRPEHIAASESVLTCDEDG